jgi:hypothetical protein
MQQYEIKGAFDYLLKHIIERKSYENNFLIKKHKPKVYYNEDGSIDIDWEGIIIHSLVLDYKYGFIINIAPDMKTVTYYADDLLSKQQWEGRFNLDNYTTTNIPLNLLL